jgi:hypothetical protein
LEGKTMKKSKTLVATCLQARRAWEAFYYKKNDDPAKTYQSMADDLVKAMGVEAAQAFILATSNDPALPF